MSDSNLSSDFLKGMGDFDDEFATTPNTVDDGTIDNEEDDNDIIYAPETYSSVEQATIREAKAESGTLANAPSIEDVEDYIVKSHTDSDSIEKVQSKHIEKLDNLNTELKNNTKKTINIDGREVEVKDTTTTEKAHSARKHLRDAPNLSEMPKTVYAKPVEKNSNNKAKYLILSIIGIATGLFLAIQANSYYFFKNGKVNNPLTCAFSWITEKNMPIYLNDINTSIAGIAFLIGFGAIALLGLFSYLNAEQLQTSRVGHEHGNARLGTPSDFKKFKLKFMEQNDNNMLFGVYKGQELGLSLNNKKVNRSANVLVIGGTGTGKTFKYIKPNILQENCSMIVTDPSGDIFRSFAPYLLSKGYNVYLFNMSDLTLSNHYNPLMNVYDSNGNISETQVDILVDLYMKNAKAGKEAGGGDPFWDKSEKSFLTSLIYYVLENEAYKDRRCFSQILELVQKAKVDDDSDEESPLTQEMEAWFSNVGITDKNPTADGKYKTRLFYDTFRIAPQKTANTILITTAVDLQIFATKEVDYVTREHPVKEMNIDINKMASQQSYLFLGIPQSHQAYNFLIAMLYSQLYGRLYELGERKLRGKFHIGYTMGTPVFDYFDTEEEAKEFYSTISEDDIIESDYINGKKVYNIMFHDKSYKTSVLREPLVKFIKEIDKMKIWNGDEFAGGDPSLPIHINFLLDEFKNIGEIPNFLTILSTSRKYRIGSHIVIQDIGQLKTMYKEGEHETVLANVDTTVFLGSILPEDKETVQKMLGKTTIRQKSTSSSQSGLSTSYTPTEVDLMSIDEISAINQNGRDDELVIIRDVTPYLCRKLNLTEHKRWKDVCDSKKLGIKLDDYYRNNRTSSNLHKD